MEITLIGMGSALPAALTQEAAEALREADCVIGAGRLLRTLPDGCAGTRLEEFRPEQILDLLVNGAWARAVVVFSGDTGFYSGADRLAQLLQGQGIAFHLLPGLSSVQLLAARCRRPWQDWTLVSAHGRTADAVAAVMQGRPTFFLTGGALGPGELCAQLASADLGDLSVTIGENLGMPQERLLRGTAGELAGQSFAPLSVLLVEPPPLPPQRTPGWPDSTFRRAEGIPMTKQLVRAAALAVLAPAPGETAWDVGAGTGSVSIELAAAVHGAPVYAVESKPEAAALLRENRRALAAWNVRIVEGHAPEALDALPAPDVVFIGGSGGQMQPIIAAALQKAPAARLCAAAVTPQSVTAALDAMQAHGRAPQIDQLSVSRSRQAGASHLMLAQNPVWLIHSDGDKA